MLGVEGPRSATPTRPAASLVFRASYAPNGAPALEGAATCYELFASSAKRFPSRPCLGFRRRDPANPQQPLPYEFLAYAEVSQTVAEIHGAMLQVGLKPNDHVGVIGANCPEWLMAMEAMNRMSAVCVPLYETLGENAIEYIVEHSDTKLVVAQAVESLGVSVTPWDAMLEKGRKAPTPEPCPPKPGDLCTIMYTSGTTGPPKGVMITHSAMVYSISGVNSFLKHHNEESGPDDVFLSYLPLAHIFDRLVEEYMLYVGGSIGYWQGDVKKLMDDIAALRPSVFVGVPRVFERICGGICDLASPISDWLVFNKIKARLGGRVRVIISGGAPLPVQAEDFMRVSMCAPVIQGYGLTETCAASFISNPFDNRHLGTVGAPLAHTDLRLEAVPDMGYDPNPTDGSNPRGEILIRGPGVFKGYYRDEKMTLDVLDADGFFHTGDVGELLPWGALRIIDRIKNIFKLAHGEYVAVERVENAYKMCPVVDQLWVYGSSFENFLVAVVVPKESNLRQALQQQGVASAASMSFQQLTELPEARSTVLKMLQETGKESKLKGFEMIKAVHLEVEPFSVENDLLTPSFKLRRAPLQKKYQAVLSDMYAQLKSGSV
ncbi:hypothetical protein DUNSADRAFT_795 [Dunaliella salina]|uniref:AMP-dependent synthetase/ligase domain-containing protein n=1 Tax=Dunaliella salina TaxID=3046 RepID=A0ABQ7FYB6_DUNSA|nr:hypothetical protein DUNSADRAFT_795 [Dunaliella salina]|eukprot:KAF5827353.1 hypothetical protein DUNSADRAFT_795 [Dunaliella salina]